MSRKEKIAVMDWDGVLFQDGGTVVRRLGVDVLVDSFKRPSLKTIHLIFTGLLGVEVYALGSLIYGKDEKGVLESGYNEVYGEYLKGLPLNDLKNLIRVKKYHEGARLNVLKELKRAGYKVVILSNGFEEFIKEILKNGRASKYVDEVHANQLLVKQGIVQGVKLHQTGMLGKLRMFKKIVPEKNWKDCVAVGDSYCEAGVMALVGKPFAMKNGTQDLKSVVLKNKGALIEDDFSNFFKRL